MKKYIIHFLILLFIGASLPGLKAQGVFNKIKNKTEDKIVDKIFGEEDNNNGSNKNSGDNNSSSGVSNTRGGGLNAKTPDVKENIDLASKSFDDKEYSDARYAVREAILGIELEIGKNILADLPEKIESLPAVTDEDNVTSSGIGFVGLVVSRVYRSDDMELRVTVANDAAMLSAVNIYFSSGYASTSDDENIQRTKFQDENAIIEWDENSGYKLSVPFGQSSLLMIEGVNFETQEAFTAACGKFNLDHIKNQLGEKMKKGIIILLTGLLFATAGLQSQDLQARLDEAESSYNSGDLENARFALQEALNEINKAIGNDILAILPDELGIPKVENSDNVTGTNMGFAGLYVNRDFQAEGKDANFQIISDSPLLSSISSMLSLSVFMAADPNQKRIKVDGYKALMTRSENEDGSTYSWDVSLPFGDSMITLQCHGIEDGKTVEKIMNEIPVARIIEIAK